MTEDLITSQIAADLEDKERGTILELTQPVGLVEGPGDAYWVSEAWYRIGVCLQSLPSGQRVGALLAASGYVGLHFTAEVVACMAQIGQN